MAAAQSGGEPLSRKSGAAFSKVPRKILGKLLILGATGTQVATSSRGYSATFEHCINRPINSVQRSNRKLCSSSSSSNSSSSKKRSFPKICLGTFENAAPDVLTTTPAGRLIFGVNMGRPTVTNGDDAE